ncbi:MAG: hypothetical protein WCA77_00875 [Thermoplasmata archaeon]
MRRRVNELAESSKPEKRIDTLRLLDISYRREYRHFRGVEKEHEPEFVQLTVSLPQSLFDRMAGAIERAKMFRRIGDPPRKFEAGIDEFVRHGIERLVSSEEHEHTVPAGLLDTLTAIRSIPDFEERIRILKSNDPSTSVVESLDGMAHRRRAELERLDASYWKKVEKLREQEAAR